MIGLMREMQTVHTVYVTGDGCRVTGVGMCRGPGASQGTSMEGRHGRGVVCVRSSAAGHSRAGPVCRGGGGRGGQLRYLLYCSSISHLSFHVVSTPRYMSIYSCRPVPCRLHTPKALPQALVPRPSVSASPAFLSVLYRLRGPSTLPTDLRSVPPPDPLLYNAPSAPLLIATIIPISF